MRREVPGTQAGQECVHLYQTLYYSTSIAACVAAAAVDGWPPCSPFTRSREPAQLDMTIGERAVLRVDRYAGDLDAADHHCFTTIHLSLPHNLTTGLVGHAHADTASRPLPSNCRTHVNRDQVHHLQARQPIQAYKDCSRQRFTVARVR